MNTIPLTEARNTLPKLVDDVSETMERVTITKRGRPQVVILSAEEYEDIVETIELLSNRYKMASLHQAEKDAKEGKGKTVDQLAKELNIDL